VEYTEGIPLIESNREFLHQRDYEDYVQGDYLSLFSRLAFDRMKNASDPDKMKNTEFSLFIQRFRLNPYIKIFQVSPNFIDRIIYRYLNLGHYFFVGHYLQLAKTFHIKSKCLDYLEQTINEEFSLTPNDPRLNIPLLKYLVEFPTLDHLRSKVTDHKIEIIDNHCYNVLKSGNIEKFLFLLQAQKYFISSEQDSGQFYTHVLKEIYNHKIQILSWVDAIKNPFKELFAQLVTSDLNFRNISYIWFLSTYHAEFMQEESYQPMNYFKQLVKRFKKFSYSASLNSFF
jgi:hypothetical protein